MNTDTHTGAEQEIIDRLEKLPLRQVPSGLSEQIMTRVRKERVGFLSRIKTIITQPVNFSVRPAYALSVLLIIVCAFGAGRFSVEKKEDFIATTTPSSFAADDLQVKDAQAAFLIGKGLLQADKTSQAAHLLRPAALLEPENPEYAYWQGVAHWFNGEQELERKSYQRGLTYAPDSIPLLINLGHNYLNTQHYEKALEQYNSVLDLSPYQSTALYNSSLIYRKLGMGKEEAKTLKRYLDTERTGESAFKAVERLNAHGDFSFRPYQIGLRKVIVSKDLLDMDSTSKEQLQIELAPIVAILENNRKLRLDIVVFIEGNKEAAREKARSIKKRIINLSETDLRDRVTISWFDQPESVKVSDSITYKISEGLLIFAGSVRMQGKEVSI